MGGQSFFAPQPTPDSTQDLENVASQAPGQLGQALQNQQQAPPQQQVPAQQPQPDPLDQLKGQLVKQYQQFQPAPASGGPVRRLLQNFIGGMGQSMMHDAGLPTAYEQQQKALAGIQAVGNAQSIQSLRQAQESQYAPTPVIGEDDKPVLGPDGNPVMVPANHAAAIYAARMAGQYKQSVAQTNLEGPTLTPEQAGAIGHPEMAGQGLSKALGGIIQNQIGKMPVTPDMIQRYNMPPEMAGKLVKMSDVLSAERLLQQGTRTTTAQHWLPDGAGGYQLATTTNVMTKGPSSLPIAGGVPTPGTPTNPRGAGPPAGGGTPRAGGGGRILTQAPVYAYNPKTNETVLSTSQEAAQQGLTNPRKATATEIMNDTQLNNRLTDVATKVGRYEDAMKAPISQADRDMISGVLSSDKLQLGAHGFGAGVEIPVDRLNQALDAANARNMSPAAKNALLAYLNARESMMGYTRVLTGSGRSSDTSLELNLQALPSPVMPNDYINNGIGQFKQNIDLAGRGLPRMPGIPQAKDVMGAQGGESGPPVRIKLSDGRTGTIPASKLQKYQQMGATVIK